MNVENKNDLEKLLDEALDDFKPIRTTTDDELDEFMQKEDTEAAKKAAEKFQSMLERMAISIQKEEDSNETSSSKKTIENQGITESISNLLFNEAADDQELSEALAKLPISKGSLDDLMETIIQTAVSKQAMYPAVKELSDKFGPFLEEKANELDSETLHRYNEQYRILGLLMKLYNDDRGDSQDKEARAQKIANLWMELQKYGLPPPELAGKLHEDPQSSGHSERTSLENECNVM